MKNEAIVLRDIDPPIVKTLQLLRWRFASLFCQIFNENNYIFCWFFYGLDLLLLQKKSFVTWPEYLQNQQYKVLSTSTSINVVTATIVFKDML